MQEAVEDRDPEGEDRLSESEVGIEQPQPLSPGGQEGSGGGRGVTVVDRREGRERGRDGKRQREGERERKREEEGGMEEGEREGSTLSSQLQKNYPYYPYHVTATCLED